MAPRTPRVMAPAAPAATVALLRRNCLRLGPDGVALPCSPAVIALSFRAIVPSSHALTRRYGGGAPLRGAAGAAVSRRGHLSAHRQGPQVVCSGGQATPFHC